MKKDFLEEVKNINYNPTKEELENIEKIISNFDVLFEPIVVFPIK